MISFRFTFRPRPAHNAPDKFKHSLSEPLHESVLSFCLFRSSRAVKRSSIFVSKTANFQTPPAIAAQDAMIHNKGTFVVASTTIANNALDAIHAPIFAPHVSVSI
jgi:hypothetical protein